MTSPLPRWKQWVAKYRKSPPKLKSKTKMIPIASPRSKSNVTKVRSPASRSRSYSRSVSIGEKKVLPRTRAETIITRVLDVERGDPERITQMLTILGDKRIKPNQIKYLDESEFQELVKILRAKMKLFVNTDVKPRTIPLPAPAAIRASVAKSSTTTPASALNRAHILDRIAASLHPTLGADVATQRKILAVLSRNKVSVTQLKTLSDIQLGALAVQINQQVRIFG